jgi:hypothetical protein
VIAAIPRVDDALPLRSTGITALQSYDFCVDRDEARAVGTAQLNELRALPYTELRARLLDRSESVEIVGSSGARYQVKRQAVIDGPGENLRVMVSVDDGGLRAFAPMTTDFIVSPQDTFIDD